MLKDLSLRTRLELLENIERYLPKVKNAYITMAGSLSDAAYRGVPLTPQLAIELNDGEKFKADLTGFTFAYLLAAAVEGHEAESRANKSE